MSDQTNTNENIPNIPVRPLDRLSDLKRNSSQFQIPGQGKILPNQPLLPVNPELFQNTPVLRNIPLPPELIKQENNTPEIKQRKVLKGYQEVPITALPPDILARVQKITPSIAKSMRLFDPKTKDNASQFEKMLVEQMYK